MFLPSLQPISMSEAYVGGNVIVHPTAAIAPGVLLQADADSQIIIGAAVCIGMGTIIHAQGGQIEVGAGCNLGAGVLILGRGKIGEGSCIGASTTIINSTIARSQVIPPGSAIGELVSFAVLEEMSPVAPANEIAAAVDIPPEEAPLAQAPQIQASTTETPAVTETPLATEAPPATEELPNPGAIAVEVTQTTQTTTTQYSEESGAKTYGQTQLDRLMIRLFPQGSPNRPPSLSDS